MTHARIAATTAAAVLMTTFGAMANDASKVETFYGFLSNPGSQEHAAAFSENTADSWASIGDYSGNFKTKDAFLGQIAGFAELIPNLNWKIEAMHNDGDTYIVRSRATGTPVAPFFGVDGEGRSFDILTIDIHTVEDGKIVRTYHVEDWAGALQQLSGR